MRNGLDLWFSVWAVRCLEFQIGRQGRSPVQLTSSWSEDLETRRIFLRASDEWIYKWKTIRHLRWKQCDQIWQFLQIRATKYPNIWQLFGQLWKMAIIKWNCCGYILGTFLWENWATWYSKIWSHWKALGDQTWMLIAGMFLLSTFGSKILARLPISFPFPFIFVFFKQSIIFCSDLILKNVHLVLSTRIRPLNLLFTSLPS